MNKKNYISILLFLFIFIIGYLYLDKVFGTTHFYNNSIHDFKKLSQETNIDVIFYGSSHSYKTFNPLIINNTCKTISYNLGSDALALNLTDLVLEQSLRYTKPKLVVLDLYPAVTNAKISKKFKGYQLRVLDVTSNSIEKHRKIKEYFSNKEFISVYSRLIRNHSKWNNIDFFKMDGLLELAEKPFYYTNGYIGSFVSIEKETKKYENIGDIKINRTVAKPKISKKTANEILNFINVASKNNIEVLIVSAPYLQARRWHYSFFDGIQSFCDKNGLNFLNLNDYYNEIGLSIEDFQDPSHLNVFGGAKTSKYIANYINNNYNLIDKSSTKAWVNSNDQLVNFSEFLSLNIKSDTKIYYNKEFVNQIKLKKINIKQNINQFKVILELDNTKLLQKSLNKYNLAIHLYADGKQKNKLVLDRKLDSNVITLNFQSKLHSIDKIDLFLYDKSGYNGIIGKKISLTNVLK